MATIGFMRLAISPVKRPADTISVDTDLSCGVGIEHHRNQLPRGASAAVAGCHERPVTVTAPFVEDFMITVGHIINAIYTETGHTPELLRGPRRSRPLAYSRQYAFLLAYELCPHLSLVTIARAFNRDHTTILWGLKQARERLRRDPNLERWINGIQRRLRHGEDRFRGTIHLAAQASA